MKTRVSRLLPLAAAMFSVVMVGVALAQQSLPVWTFPHTPGGNYGFQNCGPAANPGATQQSCQNCCALGTSGQMYLDCTAYCDQIGNSNPPCPWYNPFCWLV